MKKLSLVVGVLVLFAVAAYVVYDVLLPGMIAKSITSEQLSYVPGKIQSRLQKIRKPVNSGAEVVVETVHKSGVSMDEIMKAIDETKEEQAFAFLDELNNTKISSTDQVFDMAKRHFPVSFDVEIFRKPFREKADVTSIRKGVRYANSYRKRDEFDSRTAKSIVKQILLQKEEEFKRLTNVN